MTNKDFPLIAVGLAVAAGVWYALKGREQAKPTPWVPPIVVQPPPMVVPASPVPTVVQPPPVVAKPPSPLGDSWKGGGGPSGPGSAWQQGGSEGGYGTKIKDDDDDDEVAWKS